MLLAEKRLALMKIEQGDSNAQTCYAAKELKHYLEMITGAVFDIVTGPVTGSPRIRISRQDEQGYDAFTLQTSDAGLDISGGIRGVIYGVYEFLEKLGCRFFTPLDEKIPVCEDLVLPELSETQKPILEYRLHNTNDLSRYRRFAVKSRINGTGNIPEKFGSSMKYALFVHTLETLIPQKLYAESHPEYFPLIDGKRFLPENPHINQRCLTNPEVLQIAIENVRKTLLAKPDCRIISISQLDNCTNCQCEKCLAVDREEGSPAGTLLRFVNAIADTLKDEFPEVIFDTLAYQYTRPAPVKTKPRPNVCVRLCSIECCFSHPFGKCSDTTRGVEHPDGTRSDFVTDLRAWGKVCDRLYIWDYVTSFSHYPAPHPNWHTLQPNLQTLVENNVKGVFEQGNSQIGGGPDLVELRQYLISKLLWDPYCDAEKHITEFLDFYYGAAAPMIREYMELVCKKCEDEDIHVGFNDRPEKAFLAEDMLDQYDAILQRAADAVAGDILRSVRVRKVQFCPQYLRLKRKAMLQGETDTAELNAFFTEWRAYGFTRIHEWVSAETAHQAFLKGMWRGEELYNHWMEEGPEEQ